MLALTNKAFLLLQIALVIFFTSISDNIVTGFSSLDIYRSSRQIWYLIFNPTTYEILENTSLIACYYVLR